MRPPTKNRLISRFFVARVAYALAGAPFSATPARSSFQAVLPFRTSDPSRGHLCTTLSDEQRSERDACGIGFVADAQGRASRQILDAALEGLANVRHRGAVAADRRTGDGAGVLLPIPPALVPGPWCGLAQVFLRDESARAAIESACEQEGIELAGWRTVPVDPGALGDTARASLPSIEQLVLLRPFGLSADEAEIRAYRARRRATRVAGRVRGLALVPDGHLQGALRGRPAWRVLPRASPGVARGAVRDLPPALLDQHEPVVGAGAALPAPLPQRRDQHHRRQRAGNAGPRGRARDSRSARGVRLRLLAARQRARAARPRRPRRPSRCLDAPAACLAGGRGTRSGRGRLPPLPRGARGAVGRAGRDRLH